jgi:hypothetical protein
MVLKEGPASYVVLCVTVAVHALFGCHDRPTVSPQAGTFVGVIDTQWGRQAFEFRMLDEATAVLDGDQLIPLKKIARAEDGEEATVRSPLALYTPMSSSPWPFQIPFTFAAGFSKGPEVQFAMNEIRSKTRLTFVARTTEPDYIEFTTVAPPGWDANSGGQSYIGRVGGKQPIYINGNAAAHTYAATAAHEIGHALGFIHEHQRPDRDAYVIINNATSNTSDTVTRADMFTPYDQLSVMHYDPPHVTARNGGPSGGYKAFELFGQVLTPQDALGFNTAYPHTCRITLPSCAIATMTYRRFMDTDSRAATAQGCVGRATEWADACQILERQWVSAEFFSYGTLVAWTSASRTGLVPTVTVASPSFMWSGDAARFPVVGNCGQAAGPVTVSVGTVTTTATCQLEMPPTPRAFWGYRFSASVDARSVPDDKAVVVRASQRNAAGEGAAQRTVLKDTQPPPTPLVASPADNQFLKVKRPIFRGTAEAWSSITALQGPDSGVVMCKTGASATGEWSCAGQQDLVEGANQLSVIARDGTYNVSSAAVRNVILDTQVPDEPEIRAPAEGSRHGSKVVFSGMAEPFAKVTVREQNAVLCSTDVAADRSWSCRTSALSLGPHRAVAKQLDRAENESPESPEVTFSVEQIPVVQLSMMSDISARQVAAVSVSGSCTVESAPVEVSLGGVERTTNCSQDAFSVVIDATALPDGEVVVTARQASGAGQGDDRRTIRKDVTPPQGTTIDVPVSGALVRQLERVVGASEPNAQITVKWAAETRTVQADGAGRWELELVPSPPQGPSTITVAAEDGLGNQGNPVVATVTVDSVAPSAPAIVSPSSNSVIDTLPMRISGIAEALAHVTLLLDGQPICEVKATDDGAFACPIEALTPGRHVVAARATDAAANESADSESTPFELRASAVIGSCSTAPSALMPLAVGWSMLVASRGRRFRRQRFFSL